MAQKDVSWILQKAWPGWTITRLIGKGSYGSVYEIQKEDFGEVFTDALKVIRVPSEGTSLPAGLSQEEKTTFLTDMAEQILKEYKILEMLSGTSNIMNCKGYVCEPDADGKGWTLLIRLELLTELDKYYQKNGCSRQDVVRLGIDICRALELCEKYKVIHRDIKPGNIFVSMHGDYKLGDFGVAKTLEETGCAATKQGTANYMAPEVYRAVPYDHTADLYSLGMVLYTLMNGCRLPFMSGANTYSEQKRAFERRIKGEALPMPSNEKGTLGRVAQKACSYNPLQRYQSAAEMRRDLERLVDSTDKAIYILPDGVARTKDIQLRFLDENGAVLHTQTYKVGEEIMLPPEPPKKDKRVFKQWFPALPKVATEDLDFTATYQVVTPPAPPKPEKPHKESNKKVLSIVVGCLLVAAIAVGLWLVKPWEMIGNKNEQPTTVQQKPDNQEDPDDNQEAVVNGEDREPEKEETGPKVSAVRLGNEKLVMVVGEETELIVDTYPREIDSDVIWSSSDSDVVSVDQNGGLRAWEEGNCTITAQADDQSDTCEITVIKREVEKLELLSEPKTKSFFVGDRIDTTGLTLRVTYNDGKTEETTTGFSTECDLSSAGTKTVTVTYGGESVEYQVAVTEAKLSAIAVSTLPNKMTYYVGEILDLTGLSLELIYENGASSYINKGYGYQLETFQFSPTTVADKNVNSVIVTYEGKQTSFEISVKESYIVELDVLLGGNKTYYIGDQFDASTLSITAISNVGTTKSVSYKDCTIDYDFSQAGSNSVAVTYGGVTQRVSVTVKSPSIKVSLGKTSGLTMQLQIEKEPANAKSDWQYTGNGVISLTTDGLVTARRTGEVEVTARLHYNGKTYTDTIVLTPEVSIKTEIVSSKDTSVPVNGEVEFEQSERVVSTEYLLAHYCIGYSPYFTSYTNSTDNSSFNANCTYHEVGWVDSGSIVASNGAGGTYWAYETGYQQAYKYNDGYRCDNSCYLWYIMDTRDNTVTEYKKTITTVTW